MNVLIIEDDPAIGKSLLRGFQEAGHDCALCRDGAKGLETARTQKFDTIILDILLPEMTGLDVLRTLRAEGIRTPVLLLTALGSVEERVTGLNAGADDYLVKPFDFSELLARVQAVSRRVVDRPAATQAVGDLSLDLSNRRVTLAGEVIELTPTEFSILELLMRHSGQVVSRRTLCEHVWDNDWEGETNVIEVHITRLRKKVDRGDAESIIRTVRGRGYALRAV